jgi:hydrogenase/urease accessory protein HupE
MVETTLISNHSMEPVLKRRLYFSMSGLRSVFALFAGLLAGVAAFAHDPGLSSAHVVRRDGGVEVKLAFAWPDLASLNSADTGSSPPDVAQLRSSDFPLGKVASGLVRIYSDRRLLEMPAVEVSPGASNPSEVFISLHWSRVSNEPVKMDFPILGQMPFGHRMMLILDNETEPVALLDARHQTWELAGARNAMNGPEPVPAPGAPVHVSWFSFMMLGIEHILTGFDHLCFLLALLLVAPRLRDVFTVITTFTVAHSLTLAAAALGAVSLSSSIVEPLIAASIAYVGLENLFLRGQPKYRLVVVFGFGLIHGLGFASGLAERLPGVTGLAVVPPLLAFNAGVEFGQLVVAACLVPLIRLVRTKPNFSVRMQPACSLVIAIAGFVWLIQRV